MRQVLGVQRRLLRMFRSNETALRGKSISGEEASTRGASARHKPSVISHLVAPCGLHSSIQRQKQDKYYFVYYIILCISC